MKLPPQIPRANSPLGRAVGQLMLKLMGWEVRGQFPNCNKFVAAVAPHTSNWDFFVAIAVKLALDVDIRFLGKHSIFIPPVSWLLRHWGGIAVRRDSPHGMVEQVSRIFAEKDALVLGLAPEGTRKHTPEWKKGFIYIAQAAQVPIVPMAIDYRNKTFTIMPPIQSDTEEEVDMLLAKVKSGYNKFMAKYPQQVSGM